MAQDEKHLKDAIIFVPGLGREMVAQHIDTVARKLAGALDRQAELADPKIKVIGAPDEEYGETYCTPVRTIGIQESGGNSFQPLADLYEFDYRDNLSKRFKLRKPLLKALIMMGVIIAVWPRFILSLVRQGKGLKDKLQVLAIGCIMIAMASYMVIMIGTAAATVTQVPGIQDVSKFAKSIFNGQVADKTSGAGKSDKNGAMVNSFQALIVMFAALGLFQKKSLKERVSTIATEYVCASNYLRMGNQKPAILGQAAALLEHIAEKKESYRRVHVVAYSFGTIVALDLLYPHVQPGARIAMVNTLVTIGCPFDVVRTYWPVYFGRRNRQTSVPARWVNLYAPLDVFGSNFRNDTRERAAEQGMGIGDQDADEIAHPDSNIVYDVGMQTAHLNLFDMLMVKGIRIHSDYWTDDDAPEVSCFDTVVKELYGDEARLSKQQGGNHV